MAANGEHPAGGREGDHANLLVNLPSGFRSPFGAFNPDLESWDIYAERMELFFTYNDIPEGKWVSALLSEVGATTYGLIRNLSYPDAPNTKTFADLVKMVKDHLYPKPLEITERYKFHQRKQKVFKSS